MLPLVGGLSLAFVRRRCFEVFYAAHHWFVVVFAAALLHAQASWYFVGGGLALWVWDRAGRWARTAAADATLLSAVAIPGTRVTALHFALPPPPPAPGGGGCPLRRALAALGCGRAEPAPATATGWGAPGQHVYVQVLPAARPHGLWFSWEDGP
jgi:hypothetical protein